MKIKQGMYVGMGGTEVDLLVYVEKVEDGIFAGHVINGNWYLSYEIATEQMTIFNPFGDELRHGVRILFADPPPMHPSYNNYNEVIAYMNDHLHRPKIVSLYLQVVYNTKRSIVRFYKRLKTSSQMFIRTWKQGSTDIKYVDMDDDIPF